MVQTASAIEHKVLDSLETSLGTQEFNRSSLANNHGS
jgi:hypothetical protein